MFHLQEAAFQRTSVATISPSAVNQLSDAVATEVNAFLMTIPGIDVVDINRTLSSVGKDGMYIALRVVVIYKVHI